MISKIVKIVLFLFVGLISLLAYVMGDSNDIFYGEATVAAEKLMTEDNIRTIDTLLSNQRIPEESDAPPMNIGQNHVLYPIVSRTDLTEAQMIESAGRLRDSLKLVSDSLGNLMQKSSSAISRRGLKYFAFVWTVFLVPFFVRKLYKRFQTKKPASIDKEFKGFQ